MERSTIIVDDYRVAELPLIKGKTLFIGNPPYVRHHLIDADAKRWFADTAAGFGVKASKLAGLHIHFYVRTLELARTGDYGVFITSSEWLDVNYGATLRNLLTQRRSEEHTSELQSLMRISYAVFCLKNKNK